MLKEVSKIQDLLKKLQPIIEDQNKILEDKDKICQNLLGKEETAEFLNSFVTFDQTVAAIDGHIDQIRQLSQLIQRALIVHYRY